MRLPRGLIDSGPSGQTLSGSAVPSTLRAGTTWELHNSGSGALTARLAYDPWASGATTTPKTCWWAAPQSGATPGTNTWKSWPSST